MRGKRGKRTFYPPDLVFLEKVTVSQSCPLILCVFNLHNHGAAAVTSFAIGQYLAAMPIPLHLPPPLTRSWQRPGAGQRQPLSLITHGHGVRRTRVLSPLPKKALVVTFDSLQKNRFYTFPGSAVLFASIWHVLSRF